MEKDKKTGLNDEKGLCFEVQNINIVTRTNIKKPFGKRIRIEKWLGDRCSKHVLSLVVFKYTIIPIK
jgi:hypothetical protein